MIGDGFALLVAVALPVVVLVTLVGLLVGSKSLEISRDELIELDRRR